MHPFVTYFQPIQHTREVCPGVGGGASGKCLAILQWHRKRLCHLSLDIAVTGIVAAGGSDCKESVCNAEDPDSGRSPGGGNGYPLQYSCLENSMDRSLVVYSPRGHKESD